LGPRPLPATWPQSPLAYVEWYSKLTSSALDHHGNMYCVKKTTTTSRVAGAVIPLSDIRQSCMLIPLFPASAVPEHWNSSNVLDLCSSFLVNNWSSKYAYQTLW
jgi:hypothetical protein